MLHKLLRFLERKLGKELPAKLRFASALPCTLLSFRAVRTQMERAFSFVFLKRKAGKKASCEAPLRLCPSLYSVVLPDDLQPDEEIPLRPSSGSHGPIQNDLLEIRQKTQKVPHRLVYGRVKPARLVHQKWGNGTVRSVMLRRLRDARLPFVSGAKQCRFRGPSVFCPRSGPSALLRTPPHFSVCTAGAGESFPRP